MPEPNRNGPPGSLTVKAPEHAIGAPFCVKWVALRPTFRNCKPTE